MQGKIIKGIAGFYYVHTSDEVVYECHAKGKFRNQNIKPLVGDNVTIDVTDETNKIGNIIKIAKRTNCLVRPAVTNVDQAVIIFAAASPEPNLNLLDRFLIMMQMQNVETVICFNKMDMVSGKEQAYLKATYCNSGCQTLFVSVEEEQGLKIVLDCLDGKTSVLAGPSGVGKSSLINRIHPIAQMLTGVISEKIQRGKHTTRHSELFCTKKDTYIMDTPGFSSLEVPKLEKEELKNYYNEFIEYADSCRFHECVHVNEPNCAVKQAVLLGEISELRYRNYLQLYEEIKDKKRY